MYKILLLCLVLCCPVLALETLNKYHHYSMWMPIYYSVLADIKKANWRLKINLYVKSLFTGYLLQYLVYFMVCLVVSVKIFFYVFDTLILFSIKIKSNKLNSFYLFI